MTQFLSHSRTPSDRRRIVALAMRTAPLIRSSWTARYTVILDTARNLASPDGLIHGFSSKAEISAEWKGFPA
jgi:hypothetical protein